MGQVKYQRPDNIETVLKQLRTVDGLSNSEIADRLGMTPNAVAGLCHRLGIKSKRQCGVHTLRIVRGTDQARRVYRRKSVSREAQRPSLQLIATQSPVTLEQRRQAVRLAARHNEAVVMAVNFATDQEIPLAFRCSVFDLTEGRCHWPVGDPMSPGFFYCGVPTGHPPYCDQHSRRLGPQKRR